MTAKDKARSLISKFNHRYDEEKKSYVVHQGIDESKRSALIAVDEIIEAIKIADNITFMYVIDYYNDVKQEIRYGY